jgi:predicted regulator of Ras-like GTPase activity (Roadblock/LC7/MglB family)
MANIRAALTALSDVEGVLGGFVIDSSGQLIGTNLPTAFDANVFAEAGPRIVRLVEASAALASGLKSCVLRFAEHKLYVKEIKGAFLGVLLGVNASVPALKVAVNLVARKIEPMLGALMSMDPAQTLPSADLELQAPDTHRSMGVPNSGRISVPPPLPSKRPGSEPGIKGSRKLS